VSTATAQLYETDFYGWLQHQANTGLDFDNLLEEIEAMGRAERRGLRSRLAVLLMHLIKWQYQPELRGRSWKTTITHQRTAIQSLLEDSPSLRSTLQDRIDHAWRDALRDAEAETGLGRDTFPQACPWAFDAFMDYDFWPDTA